MTINKPHLARPPFQQSTRLTQLLIVSTIILLIGGGFALLQEYQQGNTFGRAAGDVSVVGAPTLTAATIDTIFARVGSPMVGTGKVVEQVSRQANIDDAFALGVWWTETNDGAAGVGLADHNPGSVRGSVGYPSAFDGYTIYPSYTAAIIYWFHLLRNGYVNQGLSTVYAIARPYVGTSSYPLWAGKVINLMYNYRGMAPPPPPVVTTPKPTPTVDLAAIAAQRARQHKLTRLMQSQSDGSVVSLPNPGLVQETNRLENAGTPPTTIPRASATPALPYSAELAIVLFALLTALAIALYSLKLPRKVTAASGGRQPVTEQLVSHPPLSIEVASTTDNLPIPSAKLGSASLSAEPDAQRRITEALPRRIKLLPSSSQDRTAQTADIGIGAPATGLLSKYGQNNSNLLA